MEKRAYEIYSHVNREISISVIPGHFATKHSHVSHCIDMTKVKSQLNSAKAAAKLFADSFAGIPVDTIITLERTKMIGAFMANLRDNFLPYVMNCHVLLLTASATTGQTVNSGIEGIRYYGGSPAGAATVFGGNFKCDVPVVKLLGVDDIPDYSSYAPQDCPLCKKGLKVDAVVNSYGYSKIM